MDYEKVSASILGAIRRHKMNKRLRDMCQTEMNRDGADILTIGKPYERKNISSQTIFLPLCFVILIESAFNP